MRITDLNRDGGIGANALFVELGSFNFVIDAGLHPKVAGPLALPDFDQIRDKRVDFIIVTHCHLDHIGGLPVVMMQHPEARVLMSHASHMLVERMLRNSCNVMQRQKKEQNIPEYPLFTHEDLDSINNRFEAIPCNVCTNLERDGKKLSITPRLAGHVAGAGGFEIRYENKNYFFSGDVLFDSMRTLKGASFPANFHFDTIVLETTRGETERKEGTDRASEIERLFDVIRNTIERGGSVLIPVFALGRMQEILTVINDAFKKRRLPRCKVFGAGMGLDIADYLDQITKRYGQAKFSMKTIKELNLKRPPRRLTPGKEPPESGIYILSSGMLVERTPSYGIAASLLHQGRNTICFVGYCDPDTPGGKLLACKPGETFLFDILDYQTPLRCQVEKFELSGHADREELLEFALQAKPKTVVLTHGDAGARDWFREQLLAADIDCKVIDPTPLVPYEV